MQSPPKSEPSAESESRWGGPATILGLVLAGAAVLRLVGVRYGLPYGGLLNPGDTDAVARAWDVAHGDLDPHPFFDWPSLLLYLLAPFQWGAEPSYLAARLVVVALGVGGVAATWWLGSRAYGVLAGGVGAVVVAIAGVHVAHSRMAAPDILLTTLVTVVLALLVTGRLELAGVVTGLAIAAKWPGILLLAPLVAAGWRSWRRLTYACALAFVTFVVVSPFALVHLGETASDWWTTTSHARNGWLGFEHDAFSAFSFGGSLWHALGPALLVAGVGLVVALVVRAPADVVLATFALAYFAALLPLGSHFDRYVLPLVPVLGVLAGRFASFAPVTLLLLIVPFTWTVRDTEELTKRDTRAVAVERVERAVGSHPLAIDPGLPFPRTNLIVLQVPLSSRDPDPRRDFRFISAADIGAEYVWVNGDVADRVRAARDVHPEAARFYDALASRARLVFRLEPDDRHAGPWTALYQLPSAP